MDPNGNVLTDQIMSPGCWKHSHSALRVKCHTRPSTVWPLPVSGLMASQVPFANWPPSTLAPFSQSLDTFHCQASALSSGSWKPCPAKSVLLLLHSVWCLLLPPSALQHPSDVIYTYLCAYVRKVCLHHFLSVGWPYHRSFKARHFLRKKKRCY